VAKYLRDMDNTILAVRLKGAEAARFWKIMDLAKQRNPYADKSDVIRELLGIAPPTALTREDIEYFRTGKKKRD
jgi:hypothetical protein